MPTINFDWDRFNDSQFYGHPKNGNWDKFPQWRDDVISSNPAAWTGDLGTVRNAHKLVGYKKDVWNCACGQVGEGDWMAHLAAVVEAYEESSE